jgi:plasmid stabilization system protein ParE
VKRVVVRPAAAADIEDAYEWYESQHAGLGDEFLAALRTTRDRLLEHPEAYRVLHRNTHHALMPRRLPYALFYRLCDDTSLCRVHAREARSPKVAAPYVMATHTLQRTGRSRWSRPAR